MPSAAIAAWTINLRILLYSASLAPELAHETTGRRLLASYFLTDQAYAVSITKWKVEHTEPSRRMPYYMGAGVTLWVVWQAATPAVPDGLLSTFPRAQMQPPLVLPRQTLYPRAPEIIYYAFVPPR